MKMYTFILLLLLTAAAAAQQTGTPDVFAGRKFVPNHPHVFSDPDLEKITKPLIETAMANGRATTTLLNVPTHRILFIAISSKKTPPAENHPTENDLWIIKSGQGWVQMGGEIADPKTTSNGEIGGTAIRGGEKIRLKVGDVVNIPPKLAHQALLDPGESMTYFVVKTPNDQADRFAK